MDICVSSTARRTKAESVLQQALVIFPNYHYALGNLAKVRIAQKRYDDAVAFAPKRYERRLT